MSNNCPRCSFIGAGLFFDFVNGDKTPDGLYDFPLVPETDGAIRQCLNCGSYYRYTEKYDSDIFQPTDSLEVSGINPDEVVKDIESHRRMDSDRKKRHKAFKQKVHSRFKKEIEKLSIIERHVLETILESDYSGIYFDSLAKGLGYAKVDLIFILKKLLQPRIVIRTVKRTPPWLPKIEEGWADQNLVYTELCGNSMGL